MGHLLTFGSPRSDFGGVPTHSTSRKSTAMCPVNGQWVSTVLNEAEFAHRVERVNKNTSQCNLKVRSHRTCRAALRRRCSNRR